MQIKYNTEVRAALDQGAPIVALESTVIAHGLPHPQNFETALRLESIIRDSGAVPATIAVFKGQFHVGLGEEQIRALATQPFRKISRRDLPIAAGMKLDCATTVATTSFIANKAGIRVFATGGIGGVHRGLGSDISADLPELAQTPICVVCAGAKIVLDLPVTREWLETHGITVLGWQFDEFPAFYTRSSGLAVDERIDTAEQAAAVLKARDEVGLPSAVLVTVPISEDHAVDGNDIEKILEDALAAASAEGVSGKQLTPFLLSRMSAASGGRTLAANVALLENNARIAANIATALN